MKIATWNVERLKHRKGLDQILLECEKTAADILVLTETDARVQPNYQYCFQTPALAEIKSDYYKPTENRVSIFTNYKCIRQHPTYDRYTALCVELDTEAGPLLVYGTIIGIHGNRRTSFKVDLDQQCDDFTRLAGEGANLCICGDYNLSFSDNYYYTKDGRAKILDVFNEHRIAMLTIGQSECIDHIAISKRIISGKTIQLEEWNLDKALSDHKGIAASIF